MSLLRNFTEIQKINIRSKYVWYIIQEDTMGAIVELVKPIIFAALNSCHTKKLVCDLLDKYVEKTDNDVDNVIAATVRIALMKGC